MSKKRLPRGIRNNNPGNIKFDGMAWQGLDQPRHDGTFCRFKSPAFGLRAMIRILITYQDKRRAVDGSAIDTVREIIERWAPPSDNNPTESYINKICKDLEVDEDEIIDIHDYQVARPLLQGIVEFENGRNPYSENQYNKALALAGIDYKKPISKSKTAAAATATAGVSGAAIITEHLETFAELSPLASQFSQWGPYILAAAAIGFCAWIIKIRLDKNKD